MVGEKLKGGISHLGQNTSRLGSNIQAFGSNIKDTITFSHDHDPNEEIIYQYVHDMQRSIKALKFIKNDNERAATKYWPLFFESNVKSARIFDSLIGKDSLHFKDIENFYHDLDIMQASEETPSIHPKEMEVNSDSTNREILSFLSMVRKLEWEVLEDWAVHSDSLSIKIIEMVKHLKDALLLLKIRKSKKDKRDKIQKQMDHLGKKKGTLTDKDQAKLISLGDQNSTISTQFKAMDEKARLLLPHVLSLLDEFVETITKIILLKQLETCEKIVKTITAFTTYFGYSRDGEPISSYETIQIDWERANTPIREKVESSIRQVHGGKSHLREENITAKDEASKGEKAWFSLNARFKERKHKLKPKDHKNGIFADYLEADPLSCFEKYQIHDKNNFYKSHRIDYEDVVVPEDPKRMNVPPLPPRRNTVLSSMTINSWLSDKPHYDTSGENSSLNSLDLSSDDNDETSNHMNDSSSSLITISSINSDRPIASRYTEVITESLQELYNSEKNDIKESPITVRVDDILPRMIRSDVFHDTSSVSYQLMKFNDFFTSLQKRNGVNFSKIRLGAYDFDGVEPGDLCFKQGDQIAILFDFQSVNPLVSDFENGWSVGMIKDTQDVQRIGFVPNNFLT